MDQLILILKSNPKPELFVEVLGCLANLSLPKFNFGDLVQRHDLLNFLAEFAKPGMVEDDILLEVVMFVGAHRFPMNVAGSVHQGCSMLDCSSWDLEKKYC